MLFIFLNVNLHTKLLGHSNHQNIVHTDPKRTQGELHDLHKKTCLTGDARRGFADCRINALKLSILFTPRRQRPNLIYVYTLNIQHYLLYANLRSAVWLTHVLHVILAYSISGAYCYKIDHFYTTLFILFYKEELQ